MTCLPCLEKIALRLVRNHPCFFDLILAYETAAKGVERFDKRSGGQSETPEIHSLTREEKQVLEKRGIDPDYYVNCTVGGSCVCVKNVLCGVNDDCASTIDCTCSCIAPPKAHSSYVSNTCTSHHSCVCNPSTHRCPSSTLCTCSCAGNCWYSCDTGYVWNPVTETCDPIPTGQPLGDGIVFTK